MHDLVWIAAAIFTALTGYQIRHIIRRSYGTHIVARFGAEIIGWLGYLFGTAILLVQTNGGWHTGRGDPIGSRFDWSDTIPITLILTGLLAVGNFVRLELGGEVPAETGDEVAFPLNYVDEILESEGRASKEECKRMARALVRRAKQTGQPLPPLLDEFVSRHLDRTV